MDAYIVKYSEGSTPKIEWEGISKLNHFELLRNLSSLQIIINCETMRHVCSDKTLENAFSMIDNEFLNLLNTERKALIKKCLSYRHQRIKKILTFAS